MLGIVTMNGEHVLEVLGTRIRMPPSTHVCHIEVPGFHSVVCHVQADALCMLG